MWEAVQGQKGCVQGLISTANSSPSTEAPALWLSQQNCGGQHVSHHWLNENTIQLCGDFLAEGLFLFFLRIFFAPSQKIYWIHFEFLISFWERRKTQYFKAEFWVIGRLSSFDMKLITIYLNCHSKYLVESPIFQFTRNSHNFLPLLRAMSLHSSHCKIKRKQRLSSATSPEMPLVAQLSLHSITTDPWSNIYATAKPTKEGTMTQPKCLSQQKQSCRY